MSIKFPPVLELEFDTVAQCEEFKRVAAELGMSPDEFLFWLFARYQRTARSRRNNVLAFEAVKKDVAPDLGLDAVPRKPMARAEVKRVLLEAVRDLLEEVG